jgi:hypothetical protein
MESEAMSLEQARTAMVNQPIEMPSQAQSDECLLRRHTIRIDFLTNGCTVIIGCKSFAFENVKKAMKEINFYLKNPKEAYKKYNINY